MNELFQLSGGSVIGRNHRRNGMNNQDAYYGICTKSVAIAVVCDGCGSSLHSEVGAKLGARLVGNAIAQQLKKLESDTKKNAIAVAARDILAAVRQKVLTELRGIIQGMGEDFSQIIEEYFLFTIVGAWVTPMGATIFSIGDGVIALNGTVNILGPFPHNAPPYLTYQLLEPTTTVCQFQVHYQLPVHEVESILIGTDGVGDLIEVADKPLPGKAELVGNLSQFWQEERYGSNPDSIRRKLALVNREFTHLDWQNQQTLKVIGLLPDDTTLMVITKLGKSIL